MLYMSGTMKTGKYIWSFIKKYLIHQQKYCFAMYRKRKKMFNISEKKLIKDKPLDPYKHVHIHSLKCKFKNREPLIWNLSGKITGNTTVFQNADWTLFSWALWQWQGEFNVTVVEVRDQWMRLTNNMAATPPHRHTICFNDSL